MQNTDNTDQKDKHGFPYSDMVHSLFSFNKQS